MLIILVLSRKVGEKILIGDNITITVYEVLSGGRVRLAIDAPRDVPIYRLEILPIRGKGEQSNG